MEYPCNKVAGMHSADDPDWHHSGCWHCTDGNQCGCIQDDQFPDDLCNAAVPDLRAFHLDADGSGRFDCREYVLAARRNCHDSVWLVFRAGETKGVDGRMSVVNNIIGVYYLKYSGERRKLHIVIRKVFTPIGKMISRQRKITEIIP